MRCGAVVLVAGLLAGCGGRTGQAGSTDHDASTSPTDPRPAAPGLVFFSSDDGRTWRNASAGIPDAVFVTDLASSSRWLGISTKQHGIFRFDPASERWTAAGMRPPTSTDIDALLIDGGRIYVGTHGDGVLVSTDGGASWTALDAGLENRTVRRLTAIDHAIFAGTNGGLFSLDDARTGWTRDYGDDALQVNGIARGYGELYIGTNRGVYRTALDRRDWMPILPGRALHNIAVADGAVYAMVYDELFISKDAGEHWHSDQAGLPDRLYTFQVLAAGRRVLGGQWDGVYSRSPDAGWTKSSVGLPAGIPITEMKRYGEVVVAASSQWFSRPQKAR